MPAVMVKRLHLGSKRREIPEAIRGLLILYMPDFRLPHLRTLSTFSQRQRSDPREDFFRLFRRDTGRPNLPHDFRLPRRCDRTVARERREHPFVAEILAPGLEFFRGLANPFAQLCKGVAEAMRVEIGQAGAAERLAKYLSDRLGRAPALTLQTGRLEGPTGANSDFGLREERVGLSPKQRASKIFDPLGYYPQRFVADGEEPGREALAAFGSHLPRILKDLRLCKVDMLELERSHRAVPRTRQDGKGDQRAIAFFGIRCRRH